MPAPKVRESGKLQRLVSLAYLLSTRSEIHMDELIERLGISRKEIESDLNLLMYIGLPPYSPGELFDIFIEDDFVSMLYNDVFLSPLQLSDQERTQAVIALNKLAVQSDSDIKKSIEDIIEILDGSQANHLSIASSDMTLIKTVQKAIDKKCAIDIEYLSLNSATLTHRVVEPIRIFATASISYLYGYCRTAESRRVFRSDRIVSISLLENDKVDTAKNAWNDDFEESDQVFSHNTQSFVDLWISESADWFLDSYPHEVIDESQRHYRLQTDSPYFVARLLVAHPDVIAYIEGSIDATAIVEALETIKSRMSELARGVA